MQKSAPIFSCPIVLCFSYLVLFLRRKFFLITVSFLCHEIDVLWEAVIFLNPLMLLPIKNTYNVISPYLHGETKEDVRLGVRCLKAKIYRNFIIEEPKDLSVKIRYIK